MKAIKALLAGPGTGKTSRVKSIIDEEFSDATSILVLSFTNATVNDLRHNFEGYSNVHCYTLHSFALKINHLRDLHVLDDQTETRIIEAYAEKLNIEFDEICGFLQCITFNSMIEKCVKFIRTNSAYASDNIGHLDLLIVDEFQDFNETERELVHVLSDFAEQTFILGDDDQSIYGFKDADPDGIISLCKHKEVERIEHHNICYRCPDQVVELCTDLIKKNKNRLPKPWIKSGKNGEICLRQTMTQQETCQYICEKVKLIPDEDTVLVLSPVRFYTPELKQAFEAENIEYADFWSNRLDPETCTKLWWLKAIYGDHKIIFLLCLGKSLKLLQKGRYLKILRDAFQNGYDEKFLTETLVNLGYFPSPFSEYLIQPVPFSQLFGRHPEFHEFAEYIDEANPAESVRDLEKNINAPIQFRKDAVNVMSIHKSKGLQADHVFITGLTEGVLPNETTGIDTIEAQRRLLFVGMTRAIKTLHLLSTVEWDAKFVHKVDKNQFRYQHNKHIYHGKTSRFIEEIMG